MLFPQQSFSGKTGLGSLNIRKSFHGPAEKACTTGQLGIQFPPKA